VYCGDDMAPEINRRLSADLISGKRTLPSYYDYVASFAQFVEQYNNTPMDVLGGRTPAQVWAELTPVQVGLPAEAVLRPSQQCTVGRQTVRLHNRFYFHEALALYDGQKVVVEYDLHKDGLVWVHDKKGRLVCEAKLVNTIGVLPTSRLEEQRTKRLEGQLKRLERHGDEARLRRMDAVTADDQGAAIEALAREALPAPADKPELDKPKPTTDGKTSGDVIDIDILTWRPE
jgi:putative transposase